MLHNGTVWIRIVGARHGVEVASELGAAIVRCGVNLPKIVQLFGFEMYKRELFRINSTKGLHFGIHVKYLKKWAKCCKNLAFRHCGGVTILLCSKCVFFTQHSGGKRFGALWEGRFSVAPKVAFANV